VNATEATAVEIPTPSLASDYLTLIRPRIATLVLVTVGIGACFAAGGLPPVWIFIHAILGTALVASGSSALNQVLERDTDALMARTASRPLPMHRLSVRAALAFAVIATVLGLVELALGTNLVATAVAAVSWLSYVVAYTPLKRLTSLNTLVGAIPGALPPVIGWAAVRGQIDPAAWTLFAIVFVWQFPHFLAIAWLNREDYERAGLKMLPAVEGGQRITGFQTINYCLALVPVSLIPALRLDGSTAIAGPTYFLGALYLGAAFLGVAVLFQFSQSRVNARRLLIASLVYLPALLGLLWLDRMPGA
jgi:protoheme IX farnesyltransferase